MDFEGLRSSDFFAVDVSKGRTRTEQNQRVVKLGYRCAVNVLREVINMFERRLYDLRSSDFFAVDVSKGQLRAFLNYGSGTFVASPETRVNDGRRHHVDVLWSAQVGH